MAALTSRLTVLGDPTEDAEDILSSALATIYPDDIANTHGDAAHALSYKSPHLPKPLLLHLPDPSGEAHRKMFSHYLWNASLLLAELIESASLGVALSPLVSETEEAWHRESLASFDLGGQKCIELGAGTGLPSLMATLLGAKDVMVTDYPTPEFLETVRGNVGYNVKAEFSPLFTAAEARQNQETGGSSARKLASVQVLGHAWGTLPGGSATDSEHNDENPREEEKASPALDHHEARPLSTTTDDSTAFSVLSVPTLEGLSSSSLEQHHHAYDRVLAADCLWMGHQHDNLAASISFLLRRGSSPQEQQNTHTNTPTATNNTTTNTLEHDGGRALLVAGFHTGRQGMRSFLFSPPSPSSTSPPSSPSSPTSPSSPPSALNPSPSLQNHNLTIESIYERDCDGHERPWTWDRGFEDPGERKRWLVVAVLKPTSP